MNRHVVLNLDIEIAARLRRECRMLARLYREEWANEPGHDPGECLARALTLDGVADRLAMVGPLTTEGVAP